MELYEHQKEALKATERMTHVAYFHDMGLGKTFTGAEKMYRLGARVNLLVCQKSKINDWVEHFKKHYPFLIWDLTDKKDFDLFLNLSPIEGYHVAIINYDLLWRRPELSRLKDFTLMLDESSIIQNEKAKRSKFILKLQPKNVILLSGTPTGGKYERLWSQLHLLGWNIPRSLYWQQFICVRYLDTAVGSSIPIVTGYKNIDRLKQKMAAYGCQFLKTDEVFDLPEQNFIPIKVKSSKEYREFRKNSIVTVNDIELVGDTTLTKMLYERELCGHLNDEKIKAFRELLESTDDRVIVFYNFSEEMRKLSEICYEMKRPTSLINGSTKDLKNYENEPDSITFVQYQAGAMGLNLQKANKVIYFTLPLSSELYEQSKKRIHRIGQYQPCFYYQLLVDNSIEQKILKALEMWKDYTEKLFEKEDL